MNDLITVDYSNQQPTVSGRELHKFLEVTERYSNWFRRMLQYGFTENVDFVGCKVFNTLAKQELQDHAITIPMAKEISMIQRNEKGKQARQYFIKVEEAWNTPEMVMARGLEVARNLLVTSQERVRVLETKIEEDAPKVLFAEGVSASNDCILVRDMAKILKQNGYDTGERRLFETLREDGFLIKKEGDDYNSPTQRAMNMELFVIKESVITLPDRDPKIRKTPKITGKGQVYFLNKYAPNRGNE